MNITDFNFQQKLSTSVTPHSHPRYEFHFIIGGKGAFEYGQYIVPIRSGHFFFTHPNEEHRIVIRKKGDHIGQYRFFLEFDSNGDQEIEKVIRILTKQRFFVIGNRNRCSFEQLKCKLASGNNYLYLSACNQLSTLFYELIANDKIVSQSTYDTTIEHALRIMHDSLPGDLDLATLCEACSMNRSYFIRVFKKKIGIPPMKYYMQLKIDNACSLLTETVLPIRQIAYLLHFTDEFYFSKTFKQWKGISPSQYRNKFSGNSDN